MVSFTGQDFTHTQTLRRSESFFQWKCFPVSTVAACRWPTWLKTGRKNWSKSETKSWAWIPWNSTSTKIPTAAAAAAGHVVMNTTGMRLLRAKPWNLPHASCWRWRNNRTTSHQQSVFQYHAYKAGFIFVHATFCPKCKIMSTCKTQAHSHHALTIATRRHEYSRGLSRLLPGVLVSFFKLRFGGK